jgi:hypothetical protein
MKTSKHGVTFQEAIGEIRRQLSDDGARIADAPGSLNRAWWPSEVSTVAFVQQLYSDYGVSSGPKQIEEEFFAEVKAIHQCLDRHGNDPGLAKWQSTRKKKKGKTDPDVEAMYRSLNQRASALSIWDEIAYPLRFRGGPGIVFHISSPRDISGSPIIRGMRVDEFIRGVSVRTAQDQQEFARVRTLLDRWKLAAAGLAVLWICGVFGGLVEWFYQGYGDGFDAGFSRGVGSGVLLDLLMLGGAIYMKFEEYEDGDRSLGRRIAFVLVWIVRLGIAAAMLGAAVFLIYRLIVAIL